MARWKKWLIAVAGVVGLIPIAAGIGLWVWERQAARALNELIEQIQASGAPVYVADLIPPEIPDEANAALALRAAAGVLEPAPWRDAWERLRFGEVRPPLRDDEVAAIRGLVERNAEVWTHLEEARRRGTVRWPIDYPSLMIFILLPDLNEQRDLAEFVLLAAYLAHYDGDDSVALERLEHLPFIAEAVDQLPLLVSHLTANGIWALYSETIVQMSPEVRTGAAGNEGAAVTEQVRGVVGRLLDERSLWAGMRRAYENERVMQLDAIDAILAGRMDNEALPAAVMRPMLLTDARLLLQFMTQVVQTLEMAEDWPTFERELPREIPTRVENSRLHLAAAILMPSIERAVQNGYRVQTERRLAACALAVRWYAMEHEGRLPESLEALVPRYLPEVPLDPMDPGGGALRYRPDGDEPVLYSVGENGIDDGGSTEPKVPTWRGEMYRWQMKDAVVHLTRQPRPEVVEEAWDDEGLPEWSDRE